MRKGLFALAAIALAGATAPASALTIYGLTSQYQGNVLVTFDSDNPNNFTTAVNITGAGFGPGTNTSLFALDSRPGTNQLYALGRVTETGKDSYALFSISFTGQATNLGKIVLASDPNTAVNFKVENVGFDFNPTNGLLRVVTSGKENYSLNPDPVGGNILATRQTDVFYPGSNPNANPNVFGSAYANNFAGAGTTTLYALDGNGDLLSTQNPPASGQLGVVGALRDSSNNPIQVFNNAGFDIYGADYALFTTGDAGGNDGGSAQQPKTFADFGIQDGKFADDTLYRLNLATGVATKLGNLDRNLTAITAAPFATTPGVPEPATWAMMIGGFGFVGAAARRRRRNLAAC